MARRAGGLDSGFSRLVGRQWLRTGGCRGCGCQRPGGRVLTGIGGGGALLAGCLVGLASEGRWGWALRSFCDCQFVRRGGEGTLQAHAQRGNPVQQGQLFVEWQSALADSSLFGPCGPATIGSWPSVRGASVRFGFGVATRQRARPRAACIPRVFPGEDEATGAQAVGEGVEAHGGLALRSVGTGRVLGILPVGLDSMIGRACGEMG